MRVIAYAVGMVRIGRYALHAVQSGLFALDGGAMFGVVPKPLWTRTNPADEKNRIELGMRLLLIEGPDRTFLVDTGIGDKFDEKSNSIYKVRAKTADAALREAGFDPDSVTDVLLTHLHFDHCGGAVRSDGEPTFPNARYHVQRAQFEWARNPTLKDRASFRPEDFLPLFQGDRLTFYEGRTEVAEGIELLPVDGHTQAMQLVKISDGSQSLLYLADLAPTVAHLRLPFIMGYDNQPLKTLEEKAKHLGRAAEEGTILFFEHDPTCPAARIESGPKGFSVQEEIQIP